MRGRLVVGLVSGTMAICVASAVALAQSTVVTPASNDFLPRANIDAGAPGSSAASSIDAGAPDGASVSSAPAMAPPVAREGTDAGAAGVAPAPPPPPPPPLSPPPATAGNPAQSEASSPPSNVGFSVGLHAGYSIPHGNAGINRLSYLANGAVPVGVDAGWFFNPHLYVGGYFTYGFVTIADQTNDACVESADSSCSATLLRFGAVAHYHFLPETSFDPWVGGGIGYEIINLSFVDEDAADSTTTSGSASQALDGFTLQAEAGFDWKPISYVGIGPYVEGQAGQYFGGGNAGAIHEWLTFGLRVRTNL